MLRNHTTEAVNELRALVLAPFGRDARLIVDLLSRGSVDTRECSSVDDLISCMRENAGVAIVAEEVLTESAVAKLSICLEQQAAWSDFSLLLLTTAGEVTRVSQKRRVLREPLENVLLLERPVRPETLLSTVANALRARKRQYQIRDQIEQFEMAAETLRRTEKLAVAGRLAASIAHEINNPLESVTNLIYLLRSTPQSDEATRYLQLAEQELARVSAIASQTLKFYRDTTRATRVDVVELLESVLALYAARLAAAEIKVVCEFGDVAAVEGRSGELRQLFANLMGNAIDAIREKGTLRLRVRRIETGSSNRLRVSVGDTGSGISQELREKIFEPFVSTKGDLGTGLGLWVSKEIVDRHAGRIRVKSSTHAARQGTVFSVYLPVAAPSEPAD